MPTESKSPPPKPDDFEDVEEPEDGG